ncbi:unnamed protein product, partial [Meganyctiphanes norvegica]
CKSNEHGCIKDDQWKTSKGDIWLCGNCMEMIDEMRDNPEDFEKLILFIEEEEKKRRPIKGNDKENQHSETEREKEIIETNEKNMVRRKNTVEEKNTDNKERKVKSINLFGTDIYRGDEGTLYEGEYISDPIISSRFEYLKREKYAENKNIVFLSTSVTQLLKECEISDVKQNIEPLIPEQTRYVLMAVNNNREFTPSGGTHWSLLMYKIEENVWYHYDSAEQLNYDEAQKLAKRIHDSRFTSGMPKFITAQSTQQNNGYECGAYAMAYAEEIAEILSRKDPCEIKAINPLELKENHTKSIRKEILEQIAKEKEKEKTDNKNEENKEKSKTHRGNENKVGPREECWFWKNRKCKY